MEKEQKKLNVKAPKKPKKPRKKPLVYIIEDDADMSGLLEKYIKDIVETKTYHNAISAIQAISERKPKLILLDLLLDGPDGFTFLNEISSYADTKRIPVILVSSIGIGSAQDLEDYGVVDIMNKEIMTPEDLRYSVKGWIKLFNNGRF